MFPIAFASDVLTRDPSFSMEYACNGLKSLIQTLVFP